MTIIEVLFAIVILSGVMLALSRFGQGFSRATRNAAHLTVASDLAAARLEAIKGHGVYATLVSTFDNTSETSATVGANPSMSGYDQFTRTTDATRTTTDSTDYVTITVTVTGVVLKAPMVKTAVITAF
jgi:type II secretory pathway pseudopilin PulG